MGENDRCQFGKVVTNSLMKCSLFEPVLGLYSSGFP